MNKLVTYSLKGSAIAILSCLLLNNCSDTLLGDKYEPSVESIDSIFRFIHISDTHGSTVTIKEVNKYCQNNPCDFGVLTGDILPNDGLITSLADSPIEYFVIPGNHDADHKDGLG